MQRKENSIRKDTVTTSSKILLIDASSPYITRYELSPHVIEEVSRLELTSFAMLRLS